MPQKMGIFGRNFSAGLGKVVWFSSFDVSDWHLIMHAVLRENVQMLSCLCHGLLHISPGLSYMFQKFK